jgi:hypothetical protein
MTENNLEKITIEEKDRRLQIAIDNMPEEKRKNFWVDSKKKMSHFYMGTFTDVVLFGLSATSIIAGGVYDKPGYVALGGCGAIIGLVYSNRLIKEIENYESYLDDIRNSTNYNSTDDKNKPNLKVK